MAIPVEAEGKSVKTVAMGESSKALFGPCHICACHSGTAGKGVKKTPRLLENKIHKFKGWIVRFLLLKGTYTP